MVIESTATDTVASLGENESLRRTVSRLNVGEIAGEWTLVGPGDDCAVISAPDGRVLVTTDTMVEGHDFRLDWSSWFDLGWKAVATNVSDIAAMGGKPTSLVVALVVPSSTPISGLEAFADGLREACLALAPGCSVVGGDLASGDLVVVAVTAHGTLEGREPVLRSGAQVGDVVAVAGTLGLAACGLDLLLSGRADLVAAWDEWVGVQRRPNPPVALGVAAADAGATSMLDLSDGLARDAARVAKASGVSFDLSASALLGFEARVEGAAQALSGGDSVATARLTRQWVLGGGEDHGLLATFPASAVLPRGFRPIGVVGTASPGSVSGVTLDGVPIGELGWDSTSH